MSANTSPIRVSLPQSTPSDLFTKLANAVGLSVIAQLSADALIGFDLKLPQASRARRGSSVWVEIDRGLLSHYRAVAVAKGATVEHLLSSAMGRIWEDRSSSTN